MPGAAEGMRLLGDFALLVSDQAGAATVARLHRFRRDTNLVSDIPSEARLVPETWGEITLEAVLE